MHRMMVDSKEKEKQGEDWKKGGGAERDDDDHDDENDDSQIDPQPDALNPEPEALRF